MKIGQEERVPVELEGTGQSQEREMEIPGEDRGRVWMPGLQKGQEKSDLAWSMGRELLFYPSEPPRSRRWSFMSELYVSDSGLLQVIDL